MTATPNLQEFEGLVAEGATTVPVYREIPADTDSPVSAFLKIHRGGQGFLLESVEGGERWGRYSVLGSGPLMSLRAKEGRLRVDRRDGGAEEITGDPLDCLARVLEPFRPADTGLPERFSGGFVGYLAYDLVRSIERLPSDTVDDLGMADIAGLVADTFLIFDNVTHVIKVVGLAVADGSADLASVYQGACDRVEETIARLAGPVPLLPPAPAGTGGPLVSEIGEAGYCRSVEQAREYIRAGDIIQVVLSQRYSQPSAIHPFNAYRALRNINPSPYMYYLDLGTEVIVGASPELMVKVEDRDVAVRPIAGTIRRGRDEAEDRRLVAQMLADPKEQAEHVMLLDLARNDVGRVAETGSVSVDERMTVERYSHVNHIVSHVAGRLRPDRDRFDAFRATFPAGTLSGAPKVRAMEIIEELEPTRRGVYGGAVGYIDFGVNLDTAIAIRTLLFKDGKTHLQVGAGIVADSDPEREQAECEAKAKGLLVTLEEAADMEQEEEGEASEG